MPATATAKLPTGIRRRHARSCHHRDGWCSCAPSYEARVYSARDRREILRSFRTLSAARAWRHDTASAVGKGAMRAPTAITIRQAGETLVAGLMAGTVRKRGGGAYKPSVVHGYRAALRDRIYPEFGHRKLSGVERADVQRFAERLDGEDLSPSTVRNAVMPLRLVYRRALRDGVVAVNPTVGLELDPVTGRRERAADPAEATTLLAALPETERPLWATAFYSGLRLGELRALRWRDVDLTLAEIHVEYSWCNQTRQLVAPKSRAGTRTVPIPAILRPHIAAQRLRTHSGPDAFVFARCDGAPFEPSTVYRHAHKAWNAARDQHDQPTLHPITPHEASLMIAAGVNPKTLSELVGHASITITLDRYGHLFPGSRHQAAHLLDAYLAR